MEIVNLSLSTANAWVQWFHRLSIIIKTASGFYYACVKNSSCHHHHWYTHSGKPGILNSLLLHCCGLIDGAPISCTHSESGCRHAVSMTSITYVLRFWLVCCWGFISAAIFWPDYEICGSHCNKSHTKYFVSIYLKSSPFYHTWSCFIKWWWWLVKSTEAEKRINASLPYTVITLLMGLQAGEQVDNVKVFCRFHLYATKPISLVTNQMNDQRFYKLTARRFDLLDTKLTRLWVVLFCEIPNLPRVYKCNYRPRILKIFLRTLIVLIKI